MEFHHSWKNFHVFFGCHCRKGLEIAGNVEILRVKIINGSFDKLWYELLLEKVYHQVIEEATLPRRPQMPVRYDAPNYYYHNDLKLLYCQHSFNILHFVVVSMQKMFNQPNYQTFVELQNAIIKSCEN